MMQRILTQPFVIVAGLIERDGKILLMQEAKSSPEKGKWNHPAGWLELGEDPTQAVKREVEEETGYDFNPTHFLGVYSLFRNDLAPIIKETPHPVKLVYTGELSNQSVRPLADDSAAIRWFTPEEIRGMDGNTLRDVNIKNMIGDYFAGKIYPINLVHHHQVLFP